MKRHLEHETSKLHDMFIQIVNRATDTTKKELEGVRKYTAKGLEEVKRDTEAMREQMDEFKQILSVVYKD